MPNRRNHAQDSDKLTAYRPFDIFIEFKLGEKGQANCPSGYRLVTDENVCREKVTSWSGKRFVATGCWPLEAIGCLDDGKDIYYSNCKDTSTASHHAPVCYLAESMFTYFHFTLSFALYTLFFKRIIFFSARLNDS